MIRIKFITEKEICQTLVTSQSHSHMQIRFDSGFGRSIRNEQKEGIIMSEPSRMDKTFHIIMKRLVETGRAPHYTEAATELGVSPEEGRKAVHELFSLRGFPGWLYPNTDYITSFPPFNNLPTQYRVTIDDQQKWFAQ
jgi:hypothetical protein